MQIQIPKDMGEKLSKVSEILGFKKEEIVDRALLLYIDTIQKQLDLKQEFKDWDRLSDEALNNFERGLWKGEKSG